MHWNHYDLDQKWGAAGAIVYGRRVRLRDAEVHGTYQSFYENDNVPYAIAIWPVGDADSGWRPVLYGAGDFYFARDDGQNLHKRFTPIAPKVLNQTQAALDRHLADDAPYEASDPSIEVPAAEQPAWYVVGRGVSVYFGVMVKPGQVPKALPDGVVAIRGKSPSGKAHPRTIVGVDLAHTGEAPLAAFDPRDPRVRQAAKTLKGIFPKIKDVGFVAVPTDPAAPRASRAAQGSTQEAPADPWYARLVAAYGSLTSDGGVLSSPALDGVVHVFDTDNAPSDIGTLLEAWARRPDFAFNDMGAVIETWLHDDAAVLSLEICWGGEPDEASVVHERTLVWLRHTNGAYLVVARGLRLRATRDQFGIPDGTRATITRATLGFG